MSNKIMRIIIALIGIFMMGLGVAVNASALLGNDPVAILYDGIRNSLNLNAAQLGMVSNIVNYVIIALLLVIGRKYVNIGTVIYIIPFGSFVSIGTKLYGIVLDNPGLTERIIASSLACLTLYIGVGIFIAMEIGVDPFTGLVMVIKDKFHLDFKKTKVIFDICLVTIGSLLGGTLGVITIVTTLTAGPCIQFVAKMVSKKMNSNTKSTV